MRIVKKMVEILRRTARRAAGGINISFRGPAVTLDTSMLLLAPLTLWAIAVIYVPIAGIALSGYQAWIISGIIIVFMFASLFLHSLAHALIAGKLPKRVFLSPLGDPAQSQPAAQSAGREFLAALAGPLAQLVLAALAYAIWNLQLNQFISVTASFLIFFNLGLAAVNLTPAFPFDGGRIVRAVTWKLLGKPGAATRFALKTGWAFSAGLAGWSIFLFTQESRFSLQTAGATLLVCLLIVISLASHKGKKWDGLESAVKRNRPAMVFRTSAAVLLILPLAAISLSLLPLNDGLQAPGFTAPVKPMVQMPLEYRSDSSGSLILVTVFPQAPILAGEWVYAHFDRSIKLVPQERIVPESKTAQDVSRESYEMLLDSETTAIIAGLQLAGFTAEVNNAGARITSVMEMSPANAFLRTDDIIFDIDGSLITTPADLTSHLQQLSTQSTLKMKIERAGQVLFLDVPTMDPQEPDGAVKIGISITQHSTGYTLPFPVEIVPRKVTGGPSAGLMFTLAIYDLLTEDDLTGGRKIAGTGTISLDGRVGPIGGVQQKVVAAERAGAEYFLAPAENYDDALEMATRIKVIKVTTAQEAIDFLKSLSEGIGI